MKKTSFDWLKPQLRRLGELSRADVRLLLEAVIWLGIARLAILTLRFKHLARYLGRHMAQTEAQVDAATEAQAGRIGWAVQAMARRTPWQSACLAQAMAAQQLLRRRGIGSTLYLGLARDAGAGLVAHAWLRAGRQAVTGGRGRRYTVIATFAQAVGQPERRPPGQPSGTPPPGRRQRRRTVRPSRSPRSHRQGQD